MSEPFDFDDSRFFLACNFSDLIRPIAVVIRVLRAMGLLYRPVMPVFCYRELIDMFMETYRIVHLSTKLFQNLTDPVKLLPKKYCFRSGFDECNCSYACRLVT